MSLQKIISGGQTGVDRGALDACLELNFPCGGWCAAGRTAEDGPISVLYPLIELRSPYYDDRTRRNIVESDATLIISEGKLSGGTVITSYSIHYTKLYELFVPIQEEDLSWC